MSSTSKYLPYFTAGVVVRGFGRGSKQLGIPTANLSEDAVERLPSDFSGGIYYGWAKVNHSPVYKTVMSIGWNPFYQNEKKSIEAHIIHTFSNDFYGAKLKLIIVGYLRPEKTFASVEDLIQAIKKDIDDSVIALDVPEHKNYQNHDFFSASMNNIKDY